MVAVVDSRHAAAASSRPPDEGMNRQTDRQTDTLICINVSSVGTPGPPLDRMRAGRGEGARQQLIRYDSLLEW